jgi:hypothetical protein
MRFLPRALDRTRSNTATRQAMLRNKQLVFEREVDHAKVLAATMAWLGRAQDHTTSGDGGVARDFSLLKGWSSSYPETTGYIADTVFRYADVAAQPSFHERALRMVDWLVSIQCVDGSFQGGRIDSVPKVPVTFNTGQIVLGLASAVRHNKLYREPLVKAADWLVATQDADGCWRRHASPFAAPGDKRYDTHVAWGLFEAERVAPGKGYGEAGMRNVHWAIKGLPANGWFDQCALSQAPNPITHTLGYALRGVVEAYRWSAEAALLDAAQRTADGLMSALNPDGYLPGMLDRNWQAVAPWACLTGTAQVAICWQMLARLLDRKDYLDAAQRATAYVATTVVLDGDTEVCGAVQGSFPVDGGYGAYEYLSWGAKFLADALMNEQYGVP